MSTIRVLVNDEWVMVGNNSPLLEEDLPTEVYKHLTCDSCKRDYSEWVDVECEFPLDLCCKLDCEEVSDSLPTNNNIYM